MKRPSVQRRLFLSIIMICLAASSASANRQVGVWTTDDGLPSNVTLCVNMDSKGNLWVGTDAGLMRKNGDQMRVYTQKDGLPNNYIYFVLPDKKGNIWVGTDQGLALIKDDEITVFRKKHGLPGEWFYCGAVDANDTKYFSIRGYGLAQYDEKGVRYHNPKNGFPSWFVNDIEVSPDGEIWCATYKGLVRKHGDAWELINTDDGLVADNSFSVAVDSKGRIWHGSWGNGITLIDKDAKKIWRKSSSLRSGFIADLIIDTSGIIWAGTAKGGLSLFIHGRWMVSQQVPFLGDINIPADSFIYDIYQDKAGYIYICTWGQGLLVISPDMP